MAHHGHVHLLSLTPLEWNSLATGLDESDLDEFINLEEKGRKPLFIAMAARGETKTYC